MLTTAADLSRNLTLAWWPLLLVAALVTLPWLIRQSWRWLMARNDLYITHMVDHALDSVSLDNLMDGDDWALAHHFDANRAGYERLLAAIDFDVDDALALANDHTFDNTLGEIRALPERQESA